MCHTSTRFHLILLITWILTGSRISKHIQKNIKSRNDLEKEMCPNEKAGETFYHTCLYLYGT